MIALRHFARQIARARRTASDRSECARDRRQRRASRTTSQKPASFRWDTSVRMPRRSISPSSSLPERLQALRPSRSCRDSRSRFPSSTSARPSRSRAVVVKFRQLVQIDPRTARRPRTRRSRPSAAFGSASGSRAAQNLHAAARPLVASIFFAVLIGRARRALRAGEHRDRSEGPRRRAPSDPV